LTLAGCGSIGVGATIKILLLLHGNEHRLAGGVTTRVSCLALALGAAGHEVSLGNGSGPTAAAGFDLVHVFNSWPLESCLPALTMARRVGARVVFSPVALDLNGLPVFKDLLGAILNVGSPQTIDADLMELRGQVCPRTYGEDGVSVEGAAGQFETLCNATTLADHVICLSCQEQGFLRAVGADVSRSTVVENSSNFDEFGGAKPDVFRRKYGLGDYVLCVGRLEYRKNQALLAHALRGYHLPLVLIGDYGDPGYGELVRKFSGSNVIYIGRVNDRRMLASAYAGARALILPSWAEGASLAALEAAFLGTPLILSTMSSEREYFRNLADYVHPADTAGIRQALERELQTSRLADQRFKLAAFTRERYGFARHVERTLAVYRAAAAQSPRRSDDVLVPDNGRPYHRATAHILSDARPGYKDYGIARRVPRHPVTERLSIMLRNLTQSVIGGTRRWLKSRRRRRAIAKFRNEPVGEIIQVEIPITHL
jgi:glycosyltransferase involved in cell wall biosynthesis